MEDPVVKLSSVVGFQYYHILCRMADIRGVKMDVFLGTVNICMSDRIIIHDYLFMPKIQINYKTSGNYFTDNVYPRLGHAYAIALIFQDCRERCLVLALQLYSDVTERWRLKLLSYYLFRRTSKKTSKLRVTGLCEGNPPVADGFPHKGSVTHKTFPFDDVIMDYTGISGLVFMVCDKPCDKLI